MSEIRNRPMTFPSFVFCYRLLGRICDFILNVAVRVGAGRRRRCLNFSFTKMSKIRQVDKTKCLISLTCVYWVNIIRLSFQKKFRSHQSGGKSRCFTRKRYFGDTRWYVRCLQPWEGASPHLWRVKVWSWTRFVSNLILDSWQNRWMKRRKLGHFFSLGGNSAN